MCMCVRAHVCVHECIHICGGQRSALSDILKTCCFLKHCNFVTVWLGQADWPLSPRDLLVSTSSSQHWGCKWATPCLPLSQGCWGDESQVQALVRKTLDQALFVFCNNISSQEIHTRQSTFSFGFFWLFRRVQHRRDVVKICFLLIWYFRYATGLEQFDGVMDHGSDVLKGSLSWPPLSPSHLWLYSSPRRTPLFFF